MAGEGVKDIEETWPWSSFQEIYNFSWHQYILLNITDSCAIYLSIILDYEFSRLWRFSVSSNSVQTSVDGYHESGNMQKYCD